VVVLAAVFLTLLTFNTGSAPARGGALVAVDRLLVEAEEHLAAERHAEAAGTFRRARREARAIRDRPRPGGEETTRELLAARRLGEAAFGEVAATLTALEAARRARSPEARETGARLRLGPTEAEPLRAIVAEGLRADPENASLHYIRGRLESAAGDLETAVEAYEAAVRLNPDLAQAYNDLGLLYLRDEFPARAEEPGLYRERARQNFEKALLASRDAGEPLPEAHFNLGLYYASLAQRGTAELPPPEALARAEEHLRAYLRTAPAGGPDRVRAERHLGRILGGAGE
jgi:tetratricopeptide (TPR) repeat protein